MPRLACGLPPCVLAPRPLPSHPARRPSFPPRHLRHVGVAKASGVLLDGRPSSTPPRFHGPAPRSPLHRLAVRLRHSRSNTSTEYSLPGATQLSQVRLTSLATTFTLRSRSHTFNKPQHRILPQVRNNMYSRLRFSIRGTTRVLFRLLSLLAHIQVHPSHTFKRRADGKVTSS